MKIKAAAALILVFIIIASGPAYAAGSFSAYENELDIAEGETLVLEDAEFGFEMISSDEDTVSVSGDTITGLRPGSCTVTVLFSDGSRRNITVNVCSQSVRRALLLGEAAYENEKYRTGSVNSTQGINDMFDSQKYGGMRIETVMRMDSTRGEVFELIRTVFADAAADDVSVIYVNCHGGITGGVPYLKFHDGSRIYAPELERALRKVPGTIVLLIDCCQSGGFLGSSECVRRFNTQFMKAFTAFGNGGTFCTGKYKVITSCTYTQNSYRITTEKEVTETGMATVFSRALCEGAGWDLIRDKVSRMKADDDLDRAVTLSDIYEYLARRIPHYLSTVGLRQDVQVYPSGDGFVMFER